MKSWTLNQLWYANEVCFPADFARLVQKYEPELAVVHCMDFKRHGGLLSWMRIYSRADMHNGMSDLFDKILNELIGDYK